jgi:hypothetical protein
MMRRRGLPARGLSQDVIDCLIGYDRPIGAIAEIEARGGVYDRWLSYFWDDPEVAARLAQALRTHRRTLVAEARRRKLTPAWMTAHERGRR